MKLRAFAKINLSLRVFARRQDGFHDIESVMQSVSLCDVITLEPLASGIEITCDHPAVPLGKENLVYKIYDDVEKVVNLPFQKAILTSGAGFLIKKLGLEKFAQVFTPKETKFLKPDKRAFLAVLEKLKVKPEEALMVGDEIERDLIPAKNLGMKVILVDREDRIKNAPVRKIKSLKELKEILI